MRFLGRVIARANASRSATQGAEDELVAVRAQLANLDGRLAAHVDGCDEWVLEVRSLSSMLKALSADVAALNARIDEQAGALAPDTERMDSLEHGLAAVNTMVIGLGERVHAHQLSIEDLRWQSQRLAGTVKDESAIDRRLRSIEDRLLGAD